MVGLDLLLSVEFVVEEIDFLIKGVFVSVCLKFVCLIMGLMI